MDALDRQGAIESIYLCACDALPHKNPETMRTALDNIIELCSEFVLEED